MLLKADMIALLPGWEKSKGVSVELAVAVSLGLIAWRGDRLRSPGAIDSPLSREGAFLANNVIFTLFAFIVLLGTVFPLIVEAKDNRQIAVGSPFFDSLARPIGLVLLFLMAVAPVLPWRTASRELLRDRLFWPAWCGAGALILGAGHGRGRDVVVAVVVEGVHDGRDHGGGEGNAGDQPHVPDQCEAHGRGQHRDDEARTRVLGHVDGQEAIQRTLPNPVVQFGG